jgi:1-acyl-sn-glycerol-3-phosphate acyltransferase
MNKSLKKLSDLYWAAFSAINIHLDLWYNHCKVVKNFAGSLHHFHQIDLEVNEPLMNKITGKDSKQPTILVANHIGLLDFLKIWLAFGSGIRFIAKAELFHIPVLGWLFKLFGVISIDRRCYDRNALEVALEVLCKGGTIGIFIEGKINRRAKKVTAPKNGAAMLAVAGKALVIPVAVKKWRAELCKSFQWHDFRAENHKTLYRMINQQIIKEINEQLP